MIYGCFFFFGYGFSFFEFIYSDMSIDKFILFDGESFCISFSIINISDIIGVEVL